MNKYHDEPIGFETMLPAEIIELLNFYKTTTNEYSIDEDSTSMNDTFLLDEYELAMAV